MKSARSAPDTAKSWPGAMAKIWRGVPAAAQTLGKSISRRSIHVGRGDKWPSGATPPMAKPVTRRTAAASARPRGSPAKALARAGST